MPKAIFLQSLTPIPFTTFPLCISQIFIENPPLFTNHLSSHIWHCLTKELSFKADFTDPYPRRVLPIGSTSNEHMSSFSLIIARIPRTRRLTSGRAPREKVLWCIGRNIWKQNKALSHSAVRKTATFEPSLCPYVMCI